MQGKIDIIMMAFNHWDTTEKALETLVEYTPLTKFRLIFINNASEDNTREEFLKWALEQPGLDYSLIDNTINKGWIQAIKDVYPAVDKEFFLTTHNDVLFEKDWLPRMLRFFSDDRVAAVGPTIDFVAGLQSIRFNLQLPQKDSPPLNILKKEESKFLVGLFCVFRKSAVDALIEKDGYFMDERFGIGDKEEHDYCIRLNDMGYKMMIARDVFIHHDGEKGFVDRLGSREAFYRHQENNNRILLDKWGEEKVNSLFAVNLVERLKVGVGVPSRVDMWMKAFARSFALLRKTGTWHTLDVERYIIDEARNKMVEDALELGCEWILFIDDDMDFEDNPEAALKLISHDVDVVAGLFCQRKAPYYPVVYEIKENGQGGKELYTLLDIENTGLKEVDAVGFGFTLIRTEIFRHMSKPWFTYGDKTLGIYEDKGGLGEDIGFCVKAKRLGYRIFCDTDNPIKHLGDRQKVDYKTYLEHRFLTEIALELGFDEKTEISDIYRKVLDWMKKEKEDLLFAEDLARI